MDKKDTPTVKPDGRKMMTFAINDKSLTKLQNLIDKQGLELRKKGIRFIKAEMYQFVVDMGIGAYDQQKFVNWLSKKLQEEEV